MIAARSWRDAGRKLRRVPAGCAVAALLLATVAAGAALAAAPPAVEAEHAIVVSAQHDASEAGVRILQAGGNAIDAAVAVGYALAVVDPCCGNIGGGGFMLIHRADGHDTAINFRETAPAAATAGMFLDAGRQADREASLNGYRAVGVPGTVLGLDRALSEYGILPRRGDGAGDRAGARRLCAGPGAMQRSSRPRPVGSPPIPPRRAFSAAGRHALRAGRPPDPARSRRDLELDRRDRAPMRFIAARSPQAVAEAAAAHGGLLTEEDFAGLHGHRGAAGQLRATAAMWCCRRRRRVPAARSCARCSMCSPAGISRRSASARRASLHLMVEAMRHAYLDRNSVLGDPGLCPRTRAHC